MTNPTRDESGKSRFTLWLPNTMLDRIAELQRKNHKENAAEVVREALNVYLELLRAREEGVDLYFADRKSGDSGRIWLLPGGLPVGGKRRRK